MSGGEPGDGTYAVRAVVRTWSDAQLRRAWRVSTAEVTRPERMGEVGEMRAALLAEWERRHPGEVLGWGEGGTAPL